MGAVLKENTSYWPLVLILFFGIMIVVKPTLFDMDSYYFASLSCHPTQLRPETDSLIAGWIFTHIPCDFMVFKALLVSIFTACVILIERIGQLISRKHAHWLVFLMGGSLTWYSYFAKMEDDTLGLPFIFGSLYFLVKWAQEKKWPDFVLAMGICAIGFLVWKGIAIWALIALSMSPLTWIMAGGLLWKFRESLLPRFFAGVAEELPLAGVLSNGLILVGAWFLPTYFIPGVSLAFMLAMLKLKYSLFLGILSALGLFYYLVKRDFFLGETKAVFGFHKHTAFIALIVILNLTTIMGVYTSPPDYATTQLVQTFSVQAKDANQLRVYNDWEFGHLVAYNGLIPSNEFGPPTPSFHDTNGLVLTHQLLPCPVIGSNVDVFAYDCRKP